MSLPILPGAKPPPNFDDPLAALLACHRRIEGQLATLARIAGVVGDPARLAEVKAALPAALLYFDTAGRLHSLDEDGSLFPRLHDLPELDTLEMEHRVHEAMYLALRSCAQHILAADAVSADLAEAFRSHAAALTAAYADHIRVEETVVFPAARALPEAEIRAIGIEMRLRRG